MKTKLQLLLLAAVLIGAASCYKYPSDTDFLDERDVVLTMYDTKVNFTDFKTFAIVDSIGLIKDDDTTVVRVSNDTTQAVLAQITDHMTQRGFTKVDKDQDPDLAINVVAIKTMNTVYYYPGYWWYYPGYYSPDYWGWYDWGYYYPWYPTYAYQYETGTLVIDIADQKDADPVTKTIPVVFNAYIRGILNGHHSLDQVMGDIDQAFSQTPQLQTN